MHFCPKNNTLLLFCFPGENGALPRKPEKATKATNEIKSKNPSSATILKSKSDKSAKKTSKKLKKLSKAAPKKEYKKFTKDDNKKTPKKEEVSAPFEKFQKLAAQIDEKVRNLKQKVDNSAAVKSFQNHQVKAPAVQALPILKPAASIKPVEQPLPEVEGSGSGSGSGDSGMQKS